MRFLPQVVPLLLAGCHWGFKPHPAEGRYKTGLPETGWEQVDPGSADLAWFNRTDGAMIYTDSNCGRRYEDSSLESMTDHITRGIALGDPTKEKRLHLAERDALVRSWSGRLDGVAIEVGVMVLKRNDCVYDALLISPERSFERAWVQFERVYSGFRVEGQ